VALRRNQQHKQKKIAQHRLDDILYTFTKILVDLWS
jgi:hypothetical protein